MTKLHFPQLDARSLNPACQRKVYAIDRTKTPPPPLYKNTGGGKGQKRKGLFP